MPSIYPTQQAERENKLIYCTAHSQIPFTVHVSSCIPNEAVGGRAGQCFPFYTYAEDGTARQENITDWALKEFQTRYQPEITK
jgi:predicted helicase